MEYYNARYYSTDIRRFTQPDSYTANIYNPQDLNAYSYVTNNPLRYTDPTGHFALHNWASTILRSPGAAFQSLTKTASSLVSNVKNFFSKPQTQQIMSKTEQNTSSGGGKTFTPPANQIQQTVNKVKNIEGNTVQSGKTSTWIGPNASGSRVTYNGITYTNHALESMTPNGMIFKGTEMISNGIPPSVVENALKYGIKLPGSMPGTIQHVYENVTIVTNTTSTRVITTWKTGH